MIFNSWEFGRYAGFEVELPEIVELSYHRIFSVSILFCFSCVCFLRSSFHKRKRNTARRKFTPVIRKGISAFINANIPCLSHEKTNLLILTYDPELRIQAYQCISPELLLSVSEAGSMTAAVSYLLLSESLSHDRSD